MPASDGGAETSHSIQHRSHAVSEANRLERMSGGGVQLEMHADGMDVEISIVQPNAQVKRRAERSEDCPLEPVVGQSDGAA